MAKIPGDVGGGFDLLGEMSLEVRKRDRSGQKNARFPLRAVEFGRDDELRLGKCLRLAEMRAAAVGEQVASGFAAAACNPVRLGEGQQPAGRLMRIGRLVYPASELSLPIGRAAPRLRDGARIDAQSGRQR